MNAQDHVNTFVLSPSITPLVQPIHNHHLISSINHGSTIVQLLTVFNTIQPSMINTTVLSNPPTQQSIATLTPNQHVLHQRIESNLDPNQPSLIRQSPFKIPRTKFLTSTWSILHVPNMSATIKSPERRGSLFISSRDLGLDPRKISR
jgi:hypothetical protein